MSSIRGRILHSLPSSQAEEAPNGDNQSTPERPVLGRGRRRNAGGLHYDDTGLRFAGKVRAGFVPHLRREVFKALKPHHVDDCPFVDLPNPKSSRWGGGVTADEMREMQWVKPELVAQIRFVEWTAEGRLRHAAFLGLRSDKSAREVRREWLGLSGG